MGALGLYGDEASLFMQDLSEHGIAPKKVTTTSAFEEAKKRKAAAGAGGPAGEKGLLPEGFLEDLVVPAK